LFLSEELFTDIAAGEKYRIDVLVEAKVKGKDSLMITKATHNRRFLSACLFILAACLKNTARTFFPLPCSATTRPATSLHPLRSNFLFFRVLQFRFLTVEL